MNRRLLLAFCPLVALAVALLLYVWTPPPTSQAAFTWVYSEVLIDEALLLLSVAVLLIPLVNRHFDSLLRHEVRLTRPVMVLAVLGLVLGLLLFAFWAMVDLLGGYGGPGYTWSTYPFIVAIYNRVEFLHGPDMMGMEGFSSFCIAVLGFVTLRTRHGIGTAVKDGVTLFAAPIIMVFELALWYCSPVVMYWKVTGFTPWSLGSYLTAQQFQIVMNSPYVFSWGGNVYLLSNWLALIVSSGLFVFGLVAGFNYM